MTTYVEFIRKGEPVDPEIQQILEDLDAVCAGNELHKVMSAVSSLMVMALLRCYPDRVTRMNVAAQLYKYMCEIDS